METRSHIKHECLKIKTSISWKTIVSQTLSEFTLNIFANYGPIKVFYFYELSYKESKNMLCHGISADYQISLINVGSKVMQCFQQNT